MPKIAIVGRPNVGKSSLFNRIIGARKAIVEPHSGTTRDRLHADIQWKGKAFTLIDMAGIEAGHGRGEMADLVLQQIHRALAEADIILFVTDATVGIVPQDRDLAAMLRRTAKKICLIVNKVDNDSDASKAMEFFELGLGDPYAVSALHGRGVEKLCNDLAKDIEKRDTDVPAAEVVKVAIVGRPNVGKSSYLNALLSEDRVIVHEVAGTTRDAIDTNFNYKGRDYLLIDTAGIRHNLKLSEAADFYGSVRAKEAIKRSDVAVVLFDGYEGLTKDSSRIIDLCIEEGKAVVVVVNKWDLVEAADTVRYHDRIINEMKVIRNYPVLFISCKTGINVKATLNVIWSVYEKSKTFIPPDRLAEILESLNDAAMKGNRKVTFQSLVQDGTMPPRFIFGLKNISGINDNVKRFTENAFRAVHDFEGVPLVIRFEKIGRTKKSKRRS